MTQKAIFDYWETRNTFEDIQPDCCFACGSGRRLERCHLIAKSAGGDISNSNLVLLCGRCHEDAPMLGSSPIPMIDWINRRESEVSYALRRLHLEAESIGLIELVKRVGEPDNFYAKFGAYYREHRCDYHPRGNMFSVAAIVAFEVVSAHADEYICGLA